MRRTAPAWLLCILCLGACGTTVPIGARQVTGASEGQPPAESQGSAATPSAVGSANNTISPLNSGVGSAGGGPPSAVGTTASGSGLQNRAPGALPVSGRGWTKTTISIGYMTEKDFTNSMAKLGFNSLDAGDQAADVEAVIAAINKAGGVLGRKLVGVDVDNTFAQVTSDPNSTSEADCVAFTQDHPVVAVLNLETGLDTSAFRGCIAKNHLPVMNLSVQPVDQFALNQLGGYLIPLLVPTWDRLAPALATSLKRTGYFTGWNTTTGAPGPAPVKLGVLVTDDPQGQRDGAMMAKAFRSVGYAPYMFQYSNTGGSNDMNSAVLKFRSAGVTHVVADYNVGGFANAAQSQGYRPRYGVSTYNLPQAALETGASTGQLNGSMGLGNAPTMDVDEGKDPGPTGGSPWCYRALAAGGQRFSGHRFAASIGLAECDGIRMVAAAAMASGQLSGSGILAGVAKAAPTFPTAVVFKSAFSVTNSAFPGAGRALIFDGSCSCYTYRGSAYPI